MTQMNQRKIQKTGISTYTVSLPKTWIVRNGIKSGDTLSIYEENNQSLRILLDEKKNEVREASIDLKNFNNEVEVIRKFTSYYLDGYSKITVHSHKSISEDYRKKIVSQIKRVIGFEIVEETENKIVLQDFFSSNYLSIEKSVKREFQLSKLIIQESLKILSGEAKNLDNIRIWEEEVDRLYLLARRQINFALHNSIVLNQLNLDVSDCQHFLILMIAVEKISDSFVEIAERCHEVSEITETLKQQISQSYETLLEAYNLSFDSVFKKDFALANTALDKCDQLLNDPINLENKKLKEKDKINLYVILSKLQTKTNFIKEIAEIGLDRC